MSGKCLWVKILQYSLGASVGFKIADGLISSNSFSLLSRFEFHKICLIFTEEMSFILSFLTSPQPILKKFRAIFHHFSRLPCFTAERFFIKKEVMNVVFAIFPSLQKKEFFSGIFLFLSPVRCFVALSPLVVYLIFSVIWLSKSFLSCKFSPSLLFVFT